MKSIHFDKLNFYGKKKKLKSRNVVLKDKNAPRRIHIRFQNPCCRRYRSIGTLKIEHVYISLLYVSDRDKYKIDDFNPLNILVYTIILLK